MSASILAWGAESAPILPGAEGAAAFNISEAGVSGRFVVGDWDGAITSLIHRNTNLVTGQVPIGLFQALSVVNPRAYRYLQINDPLTCTFLNLGAAPAVAQVSCTAAPNQANALPYEGDALRQYSRSLICYGGDQVIDILAGASQQFSFQLLQAGRAGFVCVGAYGGPFGASFLEGLVVTELTHNNVALIDSPTGVTAASFSANNQDNPLWGQQIDVNDRFTITVRNDGAGTAESVGVALTAG